MNETEIIDKIAELQVKTNKNFISGTFPSIRENKLLGYERPDSNIFTTASILYLLNERKPFLSKENQDKVDEITKKGIQAYPFYQNASGIKTYNFYPTKPSQPFTPGYLLKYFKRFKLADDVDDTAMIYLTGGYKEEDFIFLKEKLKEHASYTSKNPSVYSTWFGKTVPIEYDVCVLSNLMLLLSKEPKHWNDHDEITLKYLKNCLDTDQHFSKPFEISRHYGTTPLILYHYSRLYASSNLLNEYSTKLLSDIHKARELFFDVNSRFLLDLGEKYLNPDFKVSPYNIKELKDFYFFVGAPFFAVGIQNLNFNKFNILWKSKSISLTLQLFFYDHI